MVAPPEPPDIPDDEIQESFIRASGPGGQNVNKVASAVELRFNVHLSPTLTPSVKARLVGLAGRRLTKDGWIVIRADRFRNQEQNRTDARARLAELVAEAHKVPKPRVKTRPTKASKERRLVGKSKRGDVKKGRGPVGDW